MHRPRRRQRRQTSSGSRTTASTGRRYNYTSSGSTPESISWDLTDPATGGTDHDGTRTVYAQFRTAAASGARGYRHDRRSTRRHPRRRRLRRRAVARRQPGRLLAPRRDRAARPPSTPTARTTAPTRNGADARPASLLVRPRPQQGGRASTARTTTCSVPNAGGAQPVAARSRVEAWIKPTALPASGGFPSIVDQAPSPTRCSSTARGSSSPSCRTARGGASRRRSARSSPARPTTSSAPTTAPTHGSTSTARRSR